MGLRKLAVILCIISISGCVSAPRPILDGEVRSFAATYRKAKEAGLTVAMPQGKIGMRPETGYERPFFPVYEPPRIVKMWVPAHVAEGDTSVMVAGHWSFVMVEEPHWYVEGQ